MLLHSQFWSGVEGSMILNSNTHLPANKLKDDEDLTPVNTSFLFYVWFLHFEHFPFLPYSSCCVGIGRNLVNSPKQP
jgi:hypothetical protein